MKNYLFLGMIVSSSVGGMQKPLPPHPKLLHLNPAHYFPCEKSKPQKFIVLSALIQSLLEEQTLRFRK